MGDQVADDEGLAVGVGEDEGVDEALAEHVGLELEGCVEDPEEAEDHLEGALSAQDRAGCPDRLGTRVSASRLGPRLARRRLHPVRRCLRALCPRPWVYGQRYRPDSGALGRPDRDGWLRRYGSRKSWVMQLVGVAATATGWPFKLVKTLRVAPLRHE